MQDSLLVYFQPELLMVASARWLRKHVKVSVGGIDVTGLQNVAHTNTSHLRQIGMQCSTSIGPEGWLIPQVDCICVRQRGSIEDKQLGRKISEHSASVGIFILNTFKSHSIQNA